MLEVILGVLVLGLLALNAFGQLRQFHERKAWDVERRSYVATVLAAQHSAQAAATVIRPVVDKPKPVAVPVQLDM